MQVLIFCEFSLKTPIHASKMEVLGDLIPYVGSYLNDTPKGTNTPFTRYNRLSNRFDNRFDNRVERTATVRSTGCQTPTGLYNRFDNRL